MAFAGNTKSYSFGFRWLGLMFEGKNTKANEGSNLLVMFKFIFHCPIPKSLLFIRTALLYFFRSHDANTVLLILVKIFKLS